MTRATVTSVLVTGAFGAAVCGTVAIAATGGGLRTTSPEPERAFREPASRAARSQFASLDDATLRQRGRDQLAAMRGRGERVDDMLRSLGTDPATLIAAGATPSTTVLVGPGSGGLCTIVDGLGGAGLGCSSERDAARGLSFGVFGCRAPGTMVIHGLVPSTASDVRITLRDGSAQPAAPANNLLLVPVAPGTPDQQLPDRVSWTAPSGAVDVPLGIPSDPDC